MWRFGCYHSQACTASAPVRPKGQAPHDLYHLDKKKKVRFSPDLPPWGILWILARDDRVLRAFDSCPLSNSSRPHRKCNLRDSPGWPGSEMANAILPLASLYRV